MSQLFGYLRGAAGHRAGVRVEVGLDAAPTLEPPGAQWALERPLTCVRAQVCPEVGALAEALLALRARVGPLPGVSAHVALEVFGVS